MLQNFQKVQQISFSEHPIIDSAHQSPGEFDITSEGFDMPTNFIINREFLQLLYCQALLNKVCTLQQYKLDEFIEYQCSKLSDPVTWLNNLETLFENNIDLLEASVNRYRIYTLFSVIREHRTAIKQKRSDGKIYKNQLEPTLAAEKKVTCDFLAIKSDLLKMSTSDEKISYLIDRKADYLQNEQHYYKTKNEKPLDELIDIEIEKIERIEEYKRRILKVNTSLPSGNHKKIPINGHLNVLADVFYQMLFEYSEGDGFYLDSTISEVSEMIFKVFSDKFGEDLSIGTIRTMLSPNKSDKRPKENKRIKLQSLEK